VKEINRSVPAAGFGHALGLRRANEKNARIGKLLSPPWREITFR